MQFNLKQILAAGFRWRYISCWPSGHSRFRVQLWIWHQL